MRIPFFLGDLGRPGPGSDSSSALSTTVVSGGTEVARGDSVLADEDFDFPPFLGLRGLSVDAPGAAEVGVVGCSSSVGDANDMRGICALDDGVGSSAVFLSTGSLAP